MRQKVQGKFVPVHAKKTHRRSRVTAPLMRCVKKTIHGIIMMHGTMSFIKNTGHNRGSRHGHYHDHQTSSRKEGITDDLFRPQHVGRAASLYVGCPGHLITIKPLLFIKPNCSGSSQRSKRDSRSRNNSCFHSGKTGILYQ